MIDPVKLKEAAAAAVHTAQVYGVPASLTLAQWALESGWGEHAPGHNCFGIKPYHGCFGEQMLVSPEFVHGEEERLPERFATFPAIFDCFEKHGELFHNPFYAGALESYRKFKDVEAFARSIAPVYATDPHYAEKLVGMMNNGHIFVALAAASAKLV